MVNWRAIGIGMLILGLLLAIAGGAFLYIYRNDRTRSKWWMWLLLGLGIVLAIGGIIAMLVKPTVNLATNVAYPPVTMNWSDLPNIQSRTAPTVASIPLSMLATPTVTPTATVVVPGRTNNSYGLSRSPTSYESF